MTSIKGGNNEDYDKMGVVKEGAARVSESKGTISERVEEWERIGWNKIKKVQKRLSDEELTGLVRNMGSTKFVNWLGKDRKFYYEYPTGKVKIDLNTGEIYSHGYLNEDVRRVLGI